MVETIGFWAETQVRSGLLSVALSAGRPAWDFPQRPALWSPDFPRRKRRDRPAYSLRGQIMRRNQVEMHPLPGPVQGG